MLARLARGRHPGLGLFLASLAAAAYLCAASWSASDAGFYLALGRLVAHGTIPRTNALAWTAPDYPWFATSWLYDFVLYRLVRAFGVGGVQVFSFALVTLAALGMRSAIRQVLGGGGAERLLAESVAAVAIVLILPRIDDRSYLVSWAVLTWSFAWSLKGETGGWKWRVASLPLIALGSNGHTGAAFGTGVVGLFCLEAAWRDKAFLREAAIAAGAVLALFANPGGSALVRDLFAHLHVESLVYLREYRAPELMRETAFFLVVPLLAWAAWRERRRWALVLTVLAFAVMGFRTVRFCYEFFLVASPLAALGVKRLVARRPGWAVASLVLVAAIGAANAAPALTEAVPGPRFRDDGLAVRAAAFLKREHITGRLYTSYHDGGYLAYALDQPIFQDSRPRAYPPSFWRADFAADRSPRAFQRWMDQLGVEVAVTARYPTPLTGAGKLDSPAWALVYWDQVNDVYLRRSVPRFRDLIARREFELFRRQAGSFDAVVEGIRKATPDLLARYAVEVRRYLRDSPDDPRALYASCLIDRRLGRPPRPVCAAVR